MRSARDDTKRPSRIFPFEHDTSENSAAIFKSYISMQGEIDLATGDFQIGLSRTGIGLC